MNGTAVQRFTPEDLARYFAWAYTMKTPIFMDWKGSNDIERIRESYRAVWSIPLSNPNMLDHRREIHELNNPERNWSIQAFLLNSSGALGKHFHEKKMEIFFILEGRLQRFLCAYGKKLEFRSEKESILPGTAIILPRLVAHTFYFEPGSTMIGFSNAAFDENNKDMVPVDLA